MTLKESVDILEARLEALEKQNKWLLGVIRRYAEPGLWGKDGFTCYLGRRVAVEALEHVEKRA
jgi:hypothetical protein